ncbi:hypothetical protein K9M79_00340 [Candidatus Woesearchaeota archaeon]|nr:hypothetical protein [Candidatus Woesearchaeota archaeon]
MKIITVIVLVSLFGMLIMGCQTTGQVVTGTQNGTDLDFDLKDDTCPPVPSCDACEKQCADKSEVAGTEDDGATDDKDNTDVTDDSSDMDGDDGSVMDGVQEIDTPYKIIVNETELVKVNLVAVDPDGDTVTYKFGAPLGEDGEWQTEIGDAGEYVVNVIASDGKEETSTEVVLIVLPLNNQPVITGFDDMTVSEGGTITLSPTVTDKDGDELTITYSGFMTEPEYTTTYQDAGAHEVTLTADDGTTTVSKTITITVENVNRAPTLTIDSEITAYEGDLVELSAEVSDPDGEDIVVSYGTPFNQQGEWQTKVGDEGEYEIKVIATDGSIKEEKTVQLTIIPLNSKPVITMDSDLYYDEGDNIVLNPEVVDSDGDDVILSYSGWMKKSSYQTTYDDAGVYEVTVEAYDGYETVEKTITITVADVNRAPVLSAIAGVTVTEGEMVTLNPTATDPDGDDIVISFGTPFSQKGEWQTKQGDAGEYSVQILATDGDLKDSKYVDITILSANKKPVIEISGEMTFDEGDVITLDPKVTDGDGDDVQISYSGWMTSSTYTTNYDDAGVYEVIISADDGTDTVQKTVKITVNNKNRPPVFVSN